jgi:hypothetical protein
VGACLGVLAMLWLAGCGSASEESARDAADRFVSALGSDDAGQACELLAPDTVSMLESLRPEGCERALPSLDLPGDQVTEVRVWGDAAQARSANDVLFLRELSDGWRVVAAGCQPRGESEPYECELGGS